MKLPGYNTNTHLSKNRNSRDSIKGKIAESIVQELFHVHKYNVFRFGMESSVPGVMELLNGVYKNSTADSIRYLPDLIVQDRQNKGVYFVEVKFRKNGSFQWSELKGCTFPDTYIVLVSKKHIKCLSLSELEQGRKITPSSDNCISKRSEFQLNKLKVQEFCQYVSDFFSKE